MASPGWEGLTEAAGVGAEVGVDSEDVAGARACRGVAGMGATAAGAALPKGELNIASHTMGATAACCVVGTAAGRAGSAENGDVYTAGA
jgi:hypothetical protein